MMPIRSDQGHPIHSISWAAFLRALELEHWMSRRGNCREYAAADSSFNLLKREWIRRHTHWVQGG